MVYEFDRGCWRLILEVGEVDFCNSIRFFSFFYILQEQLKVSCWQLIELLFYNFLKAAHFELLQLVPYPTTRCIASVFCVPLNSDMDSFLVICLLTLLCSLLFGFSLMFIFKCLIGVAECIHNISINSEGPCQCPHRIAPSNPHPSSAETA